MAVAQRVVLALAVMLPLAVLLACGGGGRSGSTASAVIIEGGLPPGFPADFPLYPGLKVVRSVPLGQRYIIESSSEDPPSAVAAFYLDALVSGRWERLVGGESLQPDGAAFRFTAPGFVQDGRVVVVEDAAVSGGATVAIVMPFEALTGD